MILKALLAERDEAYAEFNRRLIPTVAPETIIGVRVPRLRKLAKTYAGTDEAKRFMNSLPHERFEENALHGLLIAEMRDFDDCINALERLLPHIDNWAVCDTIAPRCFAKNRRALMIRIKRWLVSEKPYTQRFAMGMLMRHFLEDAFDPEVLRLPIEVDSDHYYVQMMQAWFYATALAKRWAETLPYIEQHRLSPWVHNKTIQKACESYRIPADRKALLKRMKRIIGRAAQSGESVRQSQRSAPRA